MPTAFPGSAAAQALALRAERLCGLDEEASQERFRELARSVGDDRPLPERVLLALELRDAGFTVVVLPIPIALVQVGRREGHCDEATSDV